MVISKKCVGATPNKDFTDFFISKLSSHHQSSSTLSQKHFDALGRFTNANCNVGTKIRKHIIDII